jgi:hypothetical protein
MWLPLIWVGLVVVVAVVLLVVVAKRKNTQDTKDKE